MQFAGTGNQLRKQAKDWLGFKIPGSSYSDEMSFLQCFKDILE